MVLTCSMSRTGTWADTSSRSRSNTSNSLVPTSANSPTAPTRAMMTARYGLLTAHRETSSFAFSNCAKSPARSPRKTARSASLSSNNSSDTVCFSSSLRARASRRSANPRRASREASRASALARRQPVVRAIQPRQDLARLRHFADANGNLIDPRLDLRRQVGAVQANHRGGRGLAGIDGKVRQLPDFHPRSFLRPAPGGQQQGRQQRGRQGRARGNPARPGRDRRRGSPMLRRSLGRGRRLHHCEPPTGSTVRQRRPVEFTAIVP